MVFKKRNQRQQDIKQHKKNVKMEQDIRKYAKKTENIPGKTKILDKKETLLDKLLLRKKSNSMKVKFLGVLVLFSMIFVGTSTTFFTGAITTVKVQHTYIENQKNNKKAIMNLNTKLLFSNNVESLVDEKDEKQHETKSIEEVLTQTEKSVTQSNAPPKEQMTEERASQNGLALIGETQNGTKIWASAPKDIVDNFIANPRQAKGTGNSSGMLTWMGVYSTPMIWLDGIGWIYCIEPYEAFPSGNWYDDGTWVNDGGIRALLWWGFPANYGGQHGLSDEGAYLRTFVALNAYLENYNRTTVEGYGDGYVNMLLQKADTQDIPSETYTVHAPAALDKNYNPTMNWLETGGYQVTGAAGTFWLENLPSGFQMIDSNNNSVSSMTIGSWFKIVTTDLSYTGSINFDVKTDITPRGSIKFSAAGVQTLMGLKARDPLPSHGTSASFKAAEGAFEGTKTRLDDTLNQNYVWDHTKLSINFSKEGYSKDYPFDANFYYKTDDLLPGDYLWTETNTDAGTVTVVGQGMVSIVPGQTVRITGIDGPTNKVAGGYIQGTKSRLNNSTEKYPWDYKKISFTVTGNGVDKTYPADANFYFKTDKLSKGTYKVKEVNTDLGTATVLGEVTVTITEDGQVITLDGAKQITNEVAYTSLEGTKKDADWLTAILKGSKFGLYDKTATGGLGNLIMEANTNRFTGKFNFNNIQITSKGYRDVLVCELEAPDGYFRATTCKEIRLLPGNHKNVIEFDFYNVPENEMSAEAIKYNHKGEVMGGISLKYEQIDGLGGNVVKLIETLKTNADGFTRFKNVPVNDENNQLLCYRITELRTEENKHFILAEPYEFCGNKDVKIVQVQIINEPKKVKVPIWKIAELNPVGITADGSEWGLYNAAEELIGSVIIKDGYAELVDLTYEALSEDISTNYWQEITPGNDALVLDTTKYYLPATDWNDIEDGDSITVEGNSAETPFINTIKTIKLAGFKYNEYKQPLEKVEWGEFAEDVIAEDGTITKTMVEKVLTDATGYFEFSEQKIYMFNGKALDYAQELSTQENLVLLTEHIEIPEIAAADYGKYKDGDILYLSTEQAPITNYQLRGSIEWWKANEDFVFLPNTQYTLYDGDKYQLATVMTDENGYAKIDNINIVLFFNEENPDSEFSTTYLRETATANEDEYDLDYAKYYLPNLQKQVTAGELEMDFVIQLSTEAEPFINNFLRGDISIVKVDEASNELKLPNTTMKFERLTGADIVEETTSINETTSIIEETTQANEETTSTIEDSTDSPRIDVKQTIELTTDENGEIQYDAALYGDWCVTEIKAPEGYILPIDENGVPTNKICFTINNENRHIALKFYNQKAPEIVLVETGEHTTFWIVFSIQLLLIFGYLLFKVRKHKRMKQAGTLALLLVTLFYFPSMSMQAAIPTVPQPKLTQEAPASIKSNVVDPTVPSPTTPIDGLPDTPPTMPETPIDGTRPDPTAPPAETVTPSPAVPGDEVETGEEEYPDTTGTYSSGYLANAGEQLAIPIISGLTIMIASIILFECVQWYKKRKQ